MNVQTLINLLVDLADKHGNDVEVRIGDYVEAGPYVHDRVGSVWTTAPDNGGVVREVILCADDTSWRDEPAPDSVLKLWAAPPTHEELIRQHCGFDPAKEENL